MTFVNIKYNFARVDISMFYDKNICCETQNISKKKKKKIQQSQGVKI